MAGAPPPYPPPVPPPGYDWKTQRRMARDQARAQRDAIRYQQKQHRYQVNGMRRGSVLGPLLLVSLGVIFLLHQTGRVPDVRLWSWYGHWWPIILIAGGVVLLAEWGFDQLYMSNPDRPHYRRSIGGGIFTLLLFFGVLGIIAHVSATHGTGNSWGFNPNWSPFSGDDLGDLDQLVGDKHESDQAVDMPFPAGDSLSIANPHGDVTLSGTSDDGQIHITVHKQVYSNSDSDADSKFQQLAPQVETNSGRVAVSMRTTSGAHADLVVSVPASADSTITTNHGDIHVSAMKAGTTLTANHGDIEVSAITGPLFAHINSNSSSVSAHAITGAVSIQSHAKDITVSDINGAVSIRGDVFGSTHLEHITGAVTFHTSRTDLQLVKLDGEVDVSPAALEVDQAVGPIVLTTSNRNITLDRVAGDVSVTDRNGTVDLTNAPPLGNVNIADRNGSVKLLVPEHAGFSVQAGTTNGNIDSDFPLSTQGSDSRKSLNGTVGSGGPTLHISTTQGDISLRKGAVEPLPPTPPSPSKITLAPPTPPTAPAPPTRDDKRSRAAKREPAINEAQ